MEIYRDSGDAAETLATVDMMWEKYQQGEDGLAIHNSDFEQYDGAVLYAARTPLDEANPNISREKYNFEVLRRNTGGSPVVLRPNDTVITVSRPNNSEDLLNDYVGPVLINSLKESGVEGEFKIMSGHNRRALWVDGKPISSFSSREKDSGFLSGVVFVDSYDVDRISDIINLRPGEEEYISQMPAVSDYPNYTGDLNETILEKLDGKVKKLADWEHDLERKAENYRGEISNESGSSHRGFCPIYEEDLVEFRNNLSGNFQ